MIKPHVDPAKPGDDRDEIWVWDTRSNTWVPKPAQDGQPAALTGPGLARAGQAGPAAGPGEGEAPGGAGHKSRNFADYSIADWMDEVAGLVIERDNLKERVGDLLREAQQQRDIASDAIKSRDSVLLDAVAFLRMLTTRSEATELLRAPQMAQALSLITQIDQVCVPRVAVGR